MHTTAFGFYTSVPVVRLQLSDLDNQHLYPLGHLAGPVFTFIEISRINVGEYVVSFLSMYLDVDLLSHMVIANFWETAKFPLMSLHHSIVPQGMHLSFSFPTHPCQNLLKASFCFLILGAIHAKQVFYC